MPRGLHSLPPIPGGLGSPGCWGQGLWGALTLIVTRRLMVNRKRRQPFILGVLVAVLVAAFRDECRPVCRPLWPGCF